jgi:hypothetical protein
MFVTDYNAPPKRREYVEGGIERRFTEAAVMLAFALHLLESAQASKLVTVYPDGEHAKIFEIVPFLERRGFQRIASVGRTKYGGRYIRGSQTIVVNPTSGKGDVVGEVQGRRVFAECKGAVINSQHNGQRSRTRKGMSELVGQLMILPDNGDRQVAVLPETYDTLRLAPILAKRCALVGIEIALVKEDGTVCYLAPQNA